MKILLFTIGLFLISLAGWSQPRIFPNAVGYGTEFKGAYEGSSTPTILTVDTNYAGSLSTSATSGSLEWCLTQNYPRIVVFEIGGVIDYSSSSSSYFTINENYCNVYGQTAPSPGITVKRQTIYINTGVHDILIQHIKFRHGDYPRPDGSIPIGDAFTVLSGSYNIVFDHSSLSWGNDETFSSGAKNFTMSNCLVYEGLHENYHVDEGSGMPEDHGFGSITNGSERVTSYNNVWAYFTNRLPAFSVDTFVMINNFATGYSLTGADYSRPDNDKNNASIVSNAFYPTPSMNDSKSDYFIYFRGFSTALDTNYKIYMEDNACNNVPDGGEQFPGIFSYLTAQEIEALLVRSPDSGAVSVADYEQFGSQNLLDSLKLYAGARPWDRDYYDSMLFVKLEVGTQDYINSTRALPGRAYSKSATGDMGSGYDFSSNNVSFTVDGSTINLTTNLVDVDAVVSAINAQMPVGTEAIKFPNNLSDYVLLQTTSTGSSESIVIAGDTEVLGIPAGTYTGENEQYPALPSSQTSHTLTIPTNPHDDSGNGYTNIQVWANTFQGEVDDIISSPPQEGGDPPPEPTVINKKCRVSNGRVKVKNGRIQ